MRTLLAVLAAPGRAGQPRLFNEAGDGFLHPVQK